MPAPDTAPAPASHHFAEVERRLTRHIRDPQRPGPQDVEQRRVRIYRELLFNNVAGFLANSFPVLRRITTDDDWAQLIRDYFRSHGARTPLFPYMPREFLRYLEGRPAILESYPPFLGELANYEWTETALAIDVNDIPSAGIDPDGDLLQGSPALNPLSRMLRCRYPVHRIRPGNVPAEPPADPTYLVVYRARNERVGFVELNIVSARLLDLLQDAARGDRCPGETWLRRIATELQHPQPEVVIEGGHKILQHLRRREVILGTWT